MILYPQDAFGDMAKRRLGIGKRHQVVEIATVDTRPAQVV